MTMEVLADWVSRVSNVVWNGLLLYLLVGTGIVFTIRTRFVQVRKFGAGWKHLFGHFSLNGEKAGKDGMSPFQALTTALRREPRLRFTLTEVNDLPVRQTPMFTLLREAGFSSSPQGLDWG